MQKMIQAFPAFIATFLAVAGVVFAQQQNPFQTVILNLDKIGAFQFLFPFMIAAAVFYGLLRKSKVFGPPETNVAVNAVVALIAAFMVSAYPILTGIDVRTQFATFFFNAVIAILTIVVGLMIAGVLFGEDLPKQISEKFRQGRGFSIILIFGILIGGGILISSGLVNVFLPPILFPEGLSEESLFTLGAFIVLGLTLVAIIAPFGGGKKP